MHDYAWAMLQMLPHSESHVKNESIMGPVKPPASINIERAAHPKITVIWIPRCHDAKFRKGRGH